MAQSRDELAEELIRGGYLEDPSIIGAFRAIDRKDFLPDEAAAQAYADVALPIGYGQTISQPLVVALMLQLLEPHAGERILDVGSGSGYQTALLASIVSKEAAGEGRKISEAEDLSLELPQGLRLSSLGKGEVIAMERIPALKEMTERNAEKYGFVSKKVVQAIAGDATKGAPPELVLSEGFDKIIAAASGKEIPVIWKTQLKVGGRIVAPVGTSIVVLDKKAQDIFVKQEYTSFTFVPLVAD